MLNRRELFIGAILAALPVRPRMGIASELNWLPEGFVLFDDSVTITSDHFKYFQWGSNGAVTLYSQSKKLFLTAHSTDDFVHIANDFAAPDLKVLSPYHVEIGDLAFFKDDCRHVLINSHGAVRRLGA